MSGIRTILEVIAMTDNDSHIAPLRRGIDTRRLTMIGLGGVIGAGLFVGSGKAIASGGPAVVLVYLATGLVVIGVMRMLAELSTAHPETGSFAGYASRELGPWAGLAVGWVYSYHWCMTVAFEAVAGAAIASNLAPGIPNWLYALIFLSALTAVNLTAVSRFAHLEYWLAIIKVAAVVVFIGIGIAAICGAFPHFPTPGLSNLRGHNGFIPHGVMPLLITSLTVFFSYFGTEMVTVAAGETQDPVRSIRRSMRSLSARVLVFYVGSILIIVTVLPWNATQVTQSPYTAVLSRLGIPAAATIMNVVVLTAVLSCLNSGIYSSSRMLFALAQSGQAPRRLARTTVRGVPATAVLIAASVGFAAVVANYFLSTTTVFTFLLGSSGALAVVVYLCICLTHIAGRRRQSPEQIAALPVRMWGAPYLPWAIVAVLVTIVIAMAVTPGNRNPLLLSSTVTLIAIGAGLRFGRSREPQCSF
ncbi:MAG: amino acid permease [Nocardia sp.]|nr:amino acid permease [Nocardia sp.]